MRRFLELLGLQAAPSDVSEIAETRTVRRIVEKLRSLPPSEARYLASFAYLLSRVANSDLDISDDETLVMEEIVRQRGHLSESQALLVVEIAKGQARLFGGTEDFQVARELKKTSTREQRLELLDCLFAVAAADDEISAVEEEQIRGIADELGLSHRELADIRSPYNAQRTVLRRFDRRATRDDEPPSS